MCADKNKISTQNVFLRRGTSFRNLKTILDFIKGVKCFYQTAIEETEEVFALNPFTTKIIGSRNSLLGAADVLRRQYRNAQYTSIRITLSARVAYKRLRSLQ